MLDMKTALFAQRISEQTHNATVTTHTMTMLLRTYWHQCSDWHRIGEWYLVENQQQEYKETRLSHTKSACRKSTNLSLVTEPSMISCAIIPSNVRIGRIENLLSQTKHFLWTQYIPLHDQLLRLLDVLSSFEDSSSNISISGSGARLASWFM